MMNPNEIELEVLEWLTSNHEAPHTIAGDIGRELGRSVEEAEILRALVTLAHAGLVASYIFDKTSSTYQQVDLSSMLTPNDVWFRATTFGQPACDATS